MRVIFLQDVPRVGKRHEVKEVNDGYASNFLLPRRLAKVATPQALAELEKSKNEIVVKKEIEEKLLEKSLAEIEGKKIILKAKADPKGNLFSAIHKKEIIAEMVRAHRAEIGENFILLEKPIKQVGEFDIPVVIKNKKSSFKLIVEKL